MDTNQSNFTEQKKDVINNNKNNKIDLRSEKNILTHPNKLRIGIDVGNMYLKMAVADNNNKIKNKIYILHKGNPIKTLKEQMNLINPEGNAQVCVTGANANLITSQIKINSVDYINALIKSVKAKFKNVRNIIDVGGGSVTLINLDENGKFKNYATNALCAAGTGSFLDEQAIRLGINYESLESFDYQNNPPSIAARCSVFAKSDLIHRQQEGYSKEAMWSGLCRSMSITMLQTLLKGKPLEGQTVLTGGVSLNNEVLKWLKIELKNRINSFPDAHITAAVGVLEDAADNGIIDWNALNEKQTLNESTEQINKLRKPLLLNKTKYPDFTVKEMYTDKWGNEIRITNWKENTELEAFLGIDIGSTSTKVILLDKEANVIADIYRKTLGDPIQATKNLFIAINDITTKKNSKLNILGSGTTGSGRKMIGHIIGADSVINEITAHVTGTLYVDPEVDTIFEIGGQDSKYMKLKNGHIHDSNMNYVCAAGTGSFIEEVARKLGFKLQEIGDAVKGCVPPFTSDRCTVFMEQDVMKLLRQGYTKEECMGAVLYSVVQNYLNKVVGHRSYSQKKIFFQGATARNTGLVAAFENLLDVEIVVSPYCHVLGALGVAEIVRNNYIENENKSKFKGLDLSSRKIKLTNETCELCNNKCKITFAHIEGEKEAPSWGYMCGRDPDEKKVKQSNTFKLFKERTKKWKNIGFDQSKISNDAKTIAIPLSLVTHTYYPLFRNFFNELGVKVRLSNPKTTHEITEMSNHVVGADFCYPAKLAHGHALKAINDEKNDFVFIPSFISSSKNEKTVNSYLCPYVQSIANIVSTSLNINKKDIKKILKPVIDFRLTASIQSKNLYDEIGKKLGVSKSKISKAWEKARKIQIEFEQWCQSEGKKAIENIKTNNKKAIVLVGRPYNIYDLGSNNSLPQKIADLGYEIIPIDMIPFNIGKFPDEHFMMYWSYGQRIINALKVVKDDPNLFAVYFSNFSCGPDSFLQSYGEQIMGEKPLLILELDEHGADAGYITRVEAFIDVIKNYEYKEQKTEIYQPPCGQRELKERKLWIPPMHHYTSRLFAASFRAYGYESESIEPEDTTAFQMGRQECRGSECLPTMLTIGSFLKKMKENGNDNQNHSFFMPTAEGPCRFGQYSLLHRMILNRNQLKETPILAPSSINSYLGIDEKVRRSLWDAIMSGDILFKSRCKIKPYEKNKGQTEDVMQSAIEKMEKFIQQDPESNLREKFKKEILPSIVNIPHNYTAKPIVGIVGEIYVRCNKFANESVVEAVENYGGEAWLSPIHEWIIYTAYYQRWASLNAGFNLKMLINDIIYNRFFQIGEKRWYKAAEELLFDRHEPHIKNVMKSGAQYLPMSFAGEAIVTVGRSIEFARNGASMIVNAAPFGCMPGTITTAIFQEIQQKENIPIVSLFYDGTGNQNERLEVYLKNIINAKNS